MKIRAKKKTRRPKREMASNGKSVSMGKAFDKRLHKAILACIAIAVSFAVGVSATDGSWARAHSETGYVNKVWKTLRAGRDFDSALEEAGAMILSKERIPAWLLDEVLDEEWLNGAISSKDMQVIWMTRAGQLSEVQAETALALEAKGWSVGASTTEESSIVTYVKTEGKCRWILAEYAQSGKETVAVLRIQHS